MSNLCFINCNENTIGFNIEKLFLIVDEFFFLKKSIFFYIYDIKLIQMKALTVFNRLKNGEVISPDDPEMQGLMEEVFRTKALLLKMNQAVDAAEVRALLAEITQTEIHESVMVFTPLYINYGKNTQIGKQVFINFDCTFLDLGGIVIEDGVLIAPKVSLLTEGHPVDPQERHSLKVAPIHIKKNAWIGANATILPGVTIGENAIVAAGAVVSQNVSDGTIVGGVPAKVIKSVMREG